MEKEKIAKDKARAEKLKEKQDKKKKPKDLKGIDYEKDLDYDSNADENEYDEASENREYFRQEVGEEPNQDFVTKKRKGKPIRAGRDDYLGKKLALEQDIPNKKRKLNNDQDDEDNDDRVEVKFKKNVQPKPKFLRFSKKKSLNKKTK